MMKVVLFTAAAMGFAMSVAAAECPGHAKVQASVDTETKVASVATELPPPVQEAVAAEETKQAE